MRAGPVWAPARTAFQPAAKRYTEAKLAPLAMPLLEELRQRTVEMRPNYDNKFEEPTVLTLSVGSVTFDGGRAVLTLTAPADKVEECRG